MIDFDTVKIQWIGDPVDEAGLREDMAKSLAGLEKVVDLVFHTHFTTGDLDGPYIYVFGDDDQLVAQYFEKSEWVSLKEWEIEENNSNDLK